MNNREKGVYKDWFCLKCHNEMQFTYHMTQDSDGNNYPVVPPLCCEEPMIDGKKYFTTRKSPQIIRDIDPYLTIACDKVTGERVYIGSRREHNEFLKRNDYIEVYGQKLEDKEPEPIITADDVYEASQKIEYYKQQKDYQEFIKGSVLGVDA